MTAEVTCRAGRGHWSIRGHQQQRPGQDDCRGHLQGWTGSLVYQRLSAAEARSGRLQRSPAGLDGVTGLPEVISSRGQVRATAEVTCRAGRGHWSTRGYLQQRPGQGDCRGHLQGWTGSLVYQRLSAAEARSGRLQRSPAGLDGVTGLPEVICSRGQVRATAEVTCRAGRGHWSIRGYPQQRPGQGDCRGHLQGWTGSLVYQRLSAAEARSGRLQRSPAGLDGVTGLSEVICSRGQVRATAEVTCRAGRGHWSTRGYQQQRPGQGDCRGHLQGWTGSLVYQRSSAAEARSGRLQRSPAGLDGVTGLSEVICSRGQIRATAEVTCRAGRGHWSIRGHQQQRPGQDDCRGHLQGWTGSLVYQRSSAAEARSG